MNEPFQSSSRSDTAPVKRGRDQVILKELKDLRTRLKNSEETILKVRRETTELKRQQKELQRRNDELKRAQRELTEQRRLQEELQQSHEDLERIVRERTDELTKAYELLRRIFASMNVHIAYLDRSFNFISVNRAFGESEDRVADFFSGKNYFALYPDMDDKALFQQVLKTGEPVTVYEKPVISSRHSERDVTYWDWSVQPVKDRDGSVAGILLTSVNVTERKRAEENNIRLAAAIESAAEAVVISDVRGIIRYVNPAFEKITGFSRKEAVGRDHHILDGGKHDEAFFSELRATIRRDGFWKGRLLNRKKDGTIYHEDCTYSPIRNPAGDIINYVSIKRDITEKLWLESIAQSVETMNNIGYIFAGVRHEIGNPVNAATMILEVLRSKLVHLEKKAVEGYLDRALSELSRVAYLLRTLKNYNMYERPHLQKINVVKFMDQFLSVVREDFRVRGITIDLAIESDAQLCFADPRALQQILLNFLTNASDALQETKAPLISIRVLKKGGMVRIQVEDNGCGMTDEEQKALFKPFYTTKAKGTGLGLVIVKKMLTMMKGSIEISSRKYFGTIVDIALLDGCQEDTAEQRLYERGQNA